MDRRQPGLGHHAATGRRAVDHAARSSGLARVLRRAGEESPELACYLLLAAATGARRSELIALRWPDVDLDAGSVSISRGIVFGPDGLVEKGTKTHSARRVSLDPRTVDALRDHRERMTVRAGTCRTVLAADAFVFSNAADCSEPWFPDSVSRSFKRLCAQEGMPDVRLHDLRHFVATQSWIQDRRREPHSAVVPVAGSAVRPEARRG